MTQAEPRASRAFTLTEILIVIVILVILAAIMIPQFTSASQGARESSLQSTLQTLRSQIQLYRIQHGEQLPNLVADWTPFTGTTTYGTPAQSFGPYMQAVPINSLNGSSVVVNGSVAANATSAPKVSACGFLYDYNGGNGTGSIYGTDNSGTFIAGSVANNVFTPY